MSDVLTTTTLLLRLDNVVSVENPDIWFDTFTLPDMSDVLIVLAFNVSNFAFVFDNNVCDCVSETNCSPVCCVDVVNVKCLRIGFDRLPSYIPDPTIDHWTTEDGAVESWFILINLIVSSFPTGPTDDVCVNNTLLHVGRTFFILSKIVIEL